MAVDSLETFSAQVRGTFQEWEDSGPRERPCSRSLMHSRFERKKYIPNLASRDVDLSKKVLSRIDERLDRLDAHCAAFDALHKQTIPAKEGVSDGSIS